MTSELPRSLSDSYAAALIPTDGQVPVYDETTRYWGFADPSGGTTYSAGDGLDLTGTTFSVESNVARKNVNNSFSVGQSITGSLTATDGLTSNQGANSAITLDELFSFASMTWGIGPSSNTGTMALLHFNDSLLFPSDKMLSLARTALTHAADTSGTGVGDKIALFGNTLALRFGFGIQANRLVAYVPSTTAFAVRTTAGAGQGSSGNDGVAIFGSGVIARLSNAATAFTYDSWGRTAAEAYQGVTGSTSPGTFFSDAAAGDTFLQALAGTIRMGVGALGSASGLRLTSTTLTLAVPLAMGANKISGLAAGTVAGDAVRFEQAALLTAANALSGVNTFNGATGTVRVAVTGGTNLASEASYFSAQGRARFGYDGTGVLIDDLGTTKRVRIASGAALPIILAPGSEVQISGAPLNMGSNLITSLPASTAAGHAVRFEDLTVGVCSARRNGAVSLATGAEVVFDTEDADPSAVFDTTTGRYTPGIAGYYKVTWNLVATIATAKAIYSSVRKNSSTAAADEKFGSLGWNGSGVSSTLGTSGSAIFLLNTTDYLSIWFYHTAGGSIALTTPNYCHMSVERIGRT
jgi:hypothetical protein